jgi:hypothetical protein
MKYSNSFHYDLEFGEVAETWVNDLFSGGLKIEVKCDKAAHRTGNIYVEVYYKGEKSGISTTQADYWIFRIDALDSAIIVSRKRLKELVRKYYNGNFIKGGDCDTSLGVLIPIKEMFS